MTNWDRGQPVWEYGFLRVYSITMFLGVILTFLTICYFWKRMKYSWEVLQIMLIIVVPSGILGARLWFVIAEGGWDHFFTFAGLSIQGSIIFGLLAVTPYLYTKRHIVDYRTVMSIVFPAVLIGQAIGRWGNFSNHEVYGKEVAGSALDWMGAMKPHMYIEGAYRQPLFFYEFITSTIGYFVLVWIISRKNWFRPGVVGAMYILWYGIVRTSMEPLRDNADIMRWGAMPVSLFIAILFIVFGLLLIIWFQFFSNNRYELIKPIKPTREWIIFGKKKDTHRRYFFFGDEIPNIVRIWIPKEDQRKYSKRDLNAGVIKK